MMAEKTARQASMVVEGWAEESRISMARVRQSLSNLKSFILPDFENYASTMVLDTKWAHGLRGIAALFVVSSHLMCIVARRIAVPCCDDEGEVMLFQLPFFRLVFAGPGWVALFLVMLGFVNAHKSLKLARAGDVEQALVGISFASFRRLFRLMIPAAAATIINWFFCNIYAFEQGAHSDAWWLATTSAVPSDTWGQAVIDLVVGLSSTWSVEDSNQYDNPQWALIYLLQASVYTFAVLMVVINFKPKCRVIALGAFALWSLDWSFRFRDPLVGLTVFSGIMFTELSLSPQILKHLFHLSPLLCPPLLFLAGLFMSFPNDKPEAAYWSNTMLTAAEKIPTRQNEYSRFFGSIGAILLLLAVIITPLLRRTLSQPFFLWLGKISFSVYLLHGLLLRTVFAWVLFAGSKPIPRWTEPDAHGDQYVEYVLPMPSKLWQAFSAGVFLVALGFVSDVYTAKAEPVFERLAKAGERLLVEERTPRLGLHERSGNGGGERGRA